MTCAWAGNWEQIAFDFETYAASHLVVSSSFRLIRGVSYWSTSEKYFSLQEVFHSLCGEGKLPYSHFEVLSCIKVLSFLQNWIPKVCCVIHQHSSKVLFFMYTSALYNTEHFKNVQHSETAVIEHTTWLKSIIQIYRYVEIWLFMNL